jgi:hypothetical protein
MEKLRHDAHTPRRVTREGIVEKETDIHTWPCDTKL